MDLTLPLCYEIALDCFGAVILKWPISFITSAFFSLSSHQVKARKRAVALQTAFIHQAANAPFFRAAALLSVAQAASTASANINLVQPTPLNLHLGW